jgi:mannitol operon repressor
MSDPSKRPPLGESHPHLNEFVAFLPELNKESDRGAVLICCSFVDELLRRTLAAFFIENKGRDALLGGFNAPLGNFSSRIAACYALGLISEIEYNDCEIFRRVRNRFAHQIHTSFADQTMSDFSKNLNLAAQDYGDVVVSAAGRFRTAGTALILNLVNRPHYVSLKRRQFSEWLR